MALMMPESRRGRPTRLLQPSDQGRPYTSETVQKFEARERVVHWRVARRPDRRRVAIDIQRESVEWPVTAVDQSLDGKAATGSNGSTTVARRNAYQRLLPLRCSLPRTVDRRIPSGRLEPEQSSSSSPKTGRSQAPSRKIFERVASGGLWPAAPVGELFRQEPVASFAPSGIRPLSVIMTTDGGLARPGHEKPIDQQPWMAAAERLRSLGGRHVWQRWLTARDADGDLPSRDRCTSLTGSSRGSTWRSRAR
jgi:hypothetical protein